MSTDLEQNSSDRAFEIEGKVKTALAAARTVWVSLAAVLYEFHEKKMWVDRGYDSFEVWLADPEVDLGRSMAYALIQNYRYFIADGPLDEHALYDYEPTKLQKVIPALKAGDVDIETALADVESLSRTDLIAKYGKPGGGAQKALEHCDLCGLQRKPA